MRRLVASLSCAVFLSLLAPPSRGAAPAAAAGRRREAAPRVWAPSGAFARGRFWGRLHKLRDGRLLFAGGLVEGVARGLDDVDVFDPVAGRWRPTAPLHQGRYEFSSVSLADGRVLVSGGHGPAGPALNSVEIYDPETGSWKNAAPMSRPRLGHRLALLHDGTVLAAGGFDGTEKLGDAEVYDPVADVWSAVGPMHAARMHPMLILLRDGKALIAGGSDEASAELYDPVKKRWTETGSMGFARYYAGLGMLPDGRVLVAGGGSTGGATATAEIYDPRTGRWDETRPMRERRLGPALAMIGSVPLVIGGENSAASLSSSEYYDAAAGAWRPGPSLAGGRCYPEVAKLDDGRILVTAGRRGLGGGLSLSSTEILGASGPLRPTVPEARSEPEPPRSPGPLARTPRPIVADDEGGPDFLPPAVSPRPKTHAVVIGVERYRETLPRADYAANDARLTAEYFRRMLGVPEENLAVLNDDRATKSDFEKYFERWLPNRVDPGDEVYVYFSGHGAPNPQNGDSYLVPFDADPTYIEQTGYPLKKLYAQLAKLPAKRVVLVLDSCFSGAGGRSVVAKGVRPLVNVSMSDVPRGLIVISASQGNQISNSYPSKRHGLFTYFFLRGLKEKGPDFRAVYEYLRPQVSRVARREFNSEQLPQWRKGK